MTPYMPSIGYILQINDMYYGAYLNNSYKWSEPIIHFPVFRTDQKSNNVDLSNDEEE